MPTIQRATARVKEIGMLFPLIASAFPVSLPSPSDLKHLKSNITASAAFPIVGALLTLNSQLFISQNPGFSSEKSSAKIAGLDRAQV
jgi:hypothetical protein